MRGLTVTCVAGDIALSSVQDPVTGETRGDVMHMWLRVGADPLDVAVQVLVREPGGRLRLEQARGRHLTFALVVQPGGVALPEPTLPAPDVKPEPVFCDECGVKHRPGENALCPKTQREGHPAWKEAARMNEWLKPHVAPAPAAEAPRKGTKAWAIQEACRIVGIAFHGIAEYDEASDCFCSESRDQDYRNGGQALAFVEAAVREKLAREKAPAPAAEATGEMSREDLAERLRQLSLGLLGIHTRKEKCEHILAAFDSLLASRDRFVLMSGTDRLRLMLYESAPEAKGEVSEEELHRVLDDAPWGQCRKRILAAFAALRTRAREAEEREAKWRSEMSAACELSERYRSIVTSALNEPPEYWYDKHDNGEWSASHAAHAIQALFVERETLKGSAAFWGRAAAHATTRGNVMERERDEAREQRDGLSCENAGLRRQRDEITDLAAAANARAEAAGKKLADVLKRADLINVATMKRATIAEVERDDLRLTVAKMEGEYQDVGKRLASCEADRKNARDEIRNALHRLSVAEAKHQDAEKKASDWKSTVEMYANAWTRTIGPPYHQKMHRIDGLALTTEERVKDLKETREKLAAAEAEVARLNEKFSRTWDDPTTDATDGAHPAWGRGFDSGATVAAVMTEAALDKEEPQCLTRNADVLRAIGRVAALRERCRRLVVAGDRLVFRIVNPDARFDLEAWAIAKGEVPK